MERSPRYFLPAEVALHNKPDDIWVSCLGRVYNVTPALESGDERLNMLLLANAGKDISRWCDLRAKDKKKGVNSVISLVVDHNQDTRRESFGAQKRTLWVENCEEVGLLSMKPRPVRIVNPLAPPSHRTSLIWVASEESVNDIMKRIERYNSHIGSYCLKSGGRALHAMKTLEENNIPDERDKYLQLGMTDNSYIPSIILYFNDDLGAD